MLAAGLGAPIQSVQNRKMINKSGISRFDKMESLSTVLDGDLNSQAVTVPASPCLLLCALMLSFDSFRWVVLSMPSN